MNFKRSTYINGVTVRGALSILIKFVKKVKNFSRRPLTEAQRKWILM